MHRAAPPPESARTRNRTPLRLISRTVPAVDPIAFLSLLEGQPRGLWSRRHHWVAHGGLLAEAFVEESESDSSAVRTIRSSLGRFSTGPGVRFFGGLAFSPARRSRPPWEAFQAARFQCPEVVVERTEGDECVLQLVVPSDPRVDASRELDAWEHRLTALEPNGPSSSVHGGAGQVPDPGNLTQMPDTLDNRARWTGMVQRALAEIAAGGLAKVVLARSITSTRRARPLSAVDRLRARNPQAWTFLFEPEHGRAFIGASPESLAVLRGYELTASAVAGSRPRGANPLEDGKLAQALLSSAKDRHEHQFVAKGMAERLRSVASEIHVPDRPRLLSLAGIHHLETLLRATCRPGVGVLDVVEALHPTAAVCGSPQTAARTFIGEHEDFDRGWYGGPVGWFDHDQDGVFVPALRCALLEQGRWHLFAGAGIVEGSDPDREWEETALKFKTALDAIDEDPSGGGDR